MASCVDGLTVVKVVEHYCGRAGPPAVVGHDGLDVAIGELDLELCEGGELVAVVSAAAAPAQPSTKPTISQRDSKHGLGLEE